MVVSKRVSVPASFFFANSGPDRFVLADVTREYAAECGCAYCGKEQQDVIYVSYDIPGAREHFVKFKDGFVSDFWDGGVVYTPEEEMARERFFYFVLCKFLLPEIPTLEEIQ